MSCFKDNRLIEVICVLIITFTMISLMIKYPYQTDNDIEDEDVYKKFGFNNSYNTSDGLMVTDIQHICGDTCNRYREICGWYTKGVYVNCTIITRYLEVWDVYRDFSIDDALQGDVVTRPLYTVHMTDIIRISNETNKPIVCEKYNYARDNYHRRYYSVNEVWGEYCHKDITEYDYMHSMYDIRCCVDEYCAVYAYSIRDYIFCECDNSLNVTTSKVYLCSNNRNDTINCYE